MQLHYYLAICFYVLLSNANFTTCLKVSLLQKLVLLHNTHTTFYISVKIYIETCVSTSALFSFPTHITCSHYTNFSTKLTYSRCLYTFSCIFIYRIINCPSFVSDINLEVWNSFTTLVLKTLCTNKSDVLIFHLLLDRSLGLWEPLASSVQKHSLIKSSICRISL